VLYRWRRVPGSTASRIDFKTFATVAGRNALCDRLQRLQIEGEVLDGAFPGRYRVRPRILNPELVSIIIPTRDKTKLLETCIRSIEQKTDYPNYEIIIVDNGSVEARTLEYFKRTPHRVLSFNQKFNYSRINNFGAQHARGKYLLFLNNDTEVISGEWISAMVEYAQQDPIGIVGAKLLYRNRTIQHVGVVLGLGGVAGHAFSRFPERTSQYFGLNNCIRNYSAVTGACMMIRKEVFDRVGGFDERLAVAFNDVDLCLRVRDRGWRIVWTPYATLYHYESASRGFTLDPAEIRFMQERWGQALLQDPFYNPNLTTRRTDFSPRP
jgi:GT2 family glycosyltransferase